MVLDTVSNNCFPVTIDVRKEKFRMYFRFGDQITFVNFTNMTDSINSCVPGCLVQGKIGRDWVFFLNGCTPSFFC